MLRSGILLPKRIYNAQCMPLAVFAYSLWLAACSCICIRLQPHYYYRNILLTPPFNLKSMNTAYITVIAILVFVFIACTPKMANQQSHPVNETATDKKGNLI